MKVTQSCPTLCNPMDCIVHGILQARVLEWIAFPSLPNPVIKSTWSPMKSNPGLLYYRQILYQLSHRGSPRILEWIFPTQGSNRGLPHCRQILYQLSYEGSLDSKEAACNAGDLGLIPGSGRSARGGIGYPLQYFGLANSMDCIVHGVTKGRT